MPIFESVRQTSCLEANLRESGSPIFWLGRLQFVSDFKQRAREAERDPVYTCNAVKSNRPKALIEHALGDESQSSGTGDRPGHPVAFDHGNGSEGWGTGSAQCAWLRVAG
jgi:hypothetical protein